MRPDAIVPEIEMPEQIEVRDDDRDERRIPVPHVREGVVPLEIVGRRHEQLPQRPIEAERALVLEEANHRILGIDVLLQQQRIGVELRGDDAVGPRLDEPRLAKLGAQTLFGEDVGWRLEAGQARGVEIEARLEVHEEMPEPTEEVLVLPPRVEVRLGADGVELDTAAEDHALELLRLDTDLERHDRVGRRRLGQIRGDLHRAERAQRQHRLLGRVEARGRVGLTLLEIEGSRHRGRRQLLEALDLDRAQRGLGADARGEIEASVVPGQIHVGAPLDLGPRVAPIGEDALHGGLGLGIRLLLEGFVELHELLHRRSHRPRVPLREAVNPLDLHRADQDGLALQHLDGDLDVLGARVLDAPGAGLSLVVAAGAVVALDALEIALDHAAIEDLVIVDDAAKEPEELGAGRRGQLLLDVRAGDGVSALDAHRVDRRRALRNRGAAEAAERAQRERRATTERSEPSLGKSLSR